MPENNYYTKSEDCSNKGCPTVTFKSKILQKRNKRVLEVLSSKPLSFNEVVKQSGLNSRYVKHCLDYLVTKKKVDRTPEVFQECKGTKGRSRVFYSIRLNTNQQEPKPSVDTRFERALNPQKSKLPSTVAVEVEFSKLKKVCKHQKGGNCLEKKMQTSLPKCTISRCPLKVNIRLVNEC